MAKQGSLGSLLQGVSQQSQHIRSDGEVTEQLNIVSDIVRGLTSRPAGILVDRSETEGADVPINVLSQQSRDAALIADGSGLKWTDFKLGGETYQLGTKAGKLFVLDKTGRPIDVSVSGTLGLSYVGEDMQVFVFDDEAFVLNRDTVVKDASSDAAVSAARIAEQEALVDKDQAFIQVLEGFFGHTYTIEVTMADGAVITGTYEAPDGTGDGDAEATASDFIAKQLSNDAETGLRHSEENDGRLSSNPQGSFIRLKSLDANNPMVSVVVGDGAGDTAMRFHRDTVDRIENLSALASNGALVRVTGEPDTTDDFYMRFATTDSSAIGGGFGREGVWEEWYDTSEDASLLEWTLPHKLSLNADGTFSFGEAEWLGRRVGDSETNPMPSFVGKSIKDITGFQSRMAFITSNTLVASRTNEPTDFFLQSALAIIDSDPVDALSTAKTEVSMNWFVPFDRDLVIFGEKHQFLITGATALTPSNVSIVQTTDFEMSPLAPPVSTGRTVLFPFDSGAFAGVKEFFSANSVDANEAVTITETLDQYMSGSISRMVGSTNFGTVLLQTSGATSDPRTVFIYKYFWDGEQKAQSAWYKWTFEDDVVNMFFDGSEIGVLLRDTTSGTFFQLLLDLDIPEHPDTGYPVTLDFQQDLIAFQTNDDYFVEGYVDDDWVVEGANGPLPETWIDSNRDDLLCVQGAGCAVPGQRIRSVDIALGDNGLYRYTFDPDTVPNGATVIVGVPYDQLLQPTMPFIRDQNGRALRNRQLTVSEFAIYLEDSGVVEAEMTSRYRSDPKTISNEVIVTANDPDDPDQNGLRTDVFLVPWGERADWSELTIKANDVRPFSITEIEWRGQQQKRGRR